MDKEVLKQLGDQMKGIVDGAMKEFVEKSVDPMVAEKVQTIVSKMRLDQALYGSDVSGLSPEQKMTLVDAVIRAKDGMVADASENGGVLIPSEVYAGIFRIAATVGLVAKGATKVPVSSMEMTVPAYTGSELIGAYTGHDAEAGETAVTLSNGLLTPKQWSVLLRIDNRLLKMANVNVADWLISLISEGLASNLDKQAFVGTSPFVGVLSDTDIPTQILASGKDTYAEFDIDEASDMIASIEESLLDGAAFYMHRTVLSELRKKKDSNGDPLITNVNANNAFVIDPKSGLLPQGMLLNFPVFTSKWLPSTAVVSQASTKFLFFGNLKGVVYGDSGSLEIAKSDSATVGGKNVFAANQIALRAINNHALTVVLKKSFVVAKTAA